MSRSEDGRHLPDGTPIVEEDTCNHCGAPRARGCDHTRLSALNYSGARIEGHCVVWVEVPGEGHVPLAPRHDLRNHSPGGYEWGYGGSGPAQLALAICTHAAGDRIGLRVYQAFKFRVIGRIQADAWTMTRQEVLDTIRSLTFA